uniref:C2H2-type domain-containing protein n=1 Tax=Ascaris lumbricoides TaxID=6252 RepID=A0A0M3I8X0_ASCLU
MPRSEIVPGRVASTSMTMQLMGSFAGIKDNNSHARTMLTNGKSRWTCRICGKMLSSKRSFDEHSNIHNQSRPFACEHCDYAAASQMTLRRHNLRNHTPRQAWGYQCPYCPELYMEPASYQQHVASRHFGKSATFGCPLAGCSFTTRCSGHFRDHLSKHRNLPRPYFGFSSLGNISLNRFLVEDKLGVGFGKRPLKQIVRPSFLAKAIEEERRYQEYMKTPINCEKVVSRVEANAQKQNALWNEKAKAFEETQVEGEVTSDNAYALFDGEQWILEDVGCLEVVVDEGQNAPKVLHEGMVEPELD